MLARHFANVPQFNRQECLSVIRGGLQARHGERHKQVRGECVEFADGFETKGIHNTIPSTLQGVRASKSIIMAGEFSKGKKCGDGSG